MSGMDDANRAPQPLEGCDTPQKLWRQRCRQWAALPALRHKKKGIWHTVTWRQYHDQARAAGLALADAGVERGQCVAILSENRPEWLYTDLGAQCMGMLGVGVYPTSSPEQLAYILQDSGARVPVVENQEQPDKALAVGNPAAFNAWLDRLAGAAGVANGIRTFDDLLAALKKRHDDFHAAGARVSDHGLESALAEPCTHAQARMVFDAVRSGRAATPEEAARYGSYLMLEFGRWDAARGWTKQLHLGALRNNNTRLLTKLGPDTGFDSIGDFPQAAALSRYLNALDSTDQLPRTILYNNNPVDNYVLGTMIGNFQDGSIPGKVQFGSGWWFLDQKEGMEWQMNTLSNLGLLSRFVGMITDSRSFVSYPRHEYFRRTLCNLLGADMAAGLIPNDLKVVGGMVRNICFANARAYFGLELAPEFANRK